MFLSYKLIMHRPFIARDYMLVKLISITITAPCVSRGMEDQDKYLIWMRFVHRPDYAVSSTQGPQPRLTKNEWHRLLTRLDHEVASGSHCELNCTHLSPNSLYPDSDANASRGEGLHEDRGRDRNKGSQATEQAETRGKAQKESASPHRSCPCGCLALAFASRVILH